MFQKKYRLFLFLLWFLIQIMLLNHYGIISTKEATKYFYEAAYFKTHHHFSESRYIFYSAYIFLHSFFKDQDVTSFFLYSLQLTFNLAGFFAFVRLTVHITGNKLCGIVAGFLLLLAFNWQFWTVYLYTESLFCNYILLFCSFYFAPNSNKKLNRLLLILLLVLIIFTRPHGLLLLLPLCVISIIKLYLEKKYLKLTALIVLLGITTAITVHHFSSKNSGFDFAKPIAESSVLCYIKTESLEAVNIESDNSFSFLMLYIYNYPEQFFYLSGRKFLSYWGLTRSYYSPLQNSWIVSYYYTAYFFALIGIYTLWRKNKIFTIFVISLFFFFTISVIFTCDDWSNRFNMPIIPFVLLLAAYGLIEYIQILKQPNE